MKKTLKVILFFIVLIVIMVISEKIDRMLDDRFYGTEVQIEEN